MRIGNVPPSGPLNSPQSPNGDPSLTPYIQDIYNYIQTVYNACQATPPDLNHINGMIADIKKRFDFFLMMAQDDYSGRFLTLAELQECRTCSARIEGDLDNISAAMSKNPPDLKAVTDSYLDAGDICLVLTDMLGPPDPPKL